MIFGPKCELSVWLGWGGQNWQHKKLSVCLRCLNYCTILKLIVHGRTKTGGGNTGGEDTSGLKSCEVTAGGDAIEMMGESINAAIDNGH